LGTFNSILTLCYFQSEFNTLTYTLIPDNRLPNAFQVQSGGVISLQTGLLTDITETYIVSYFINCVTCV